MSASFFINGSYINHIFMWKAPSQGAIKEAGISVKSSLFFCIKILIFGASVWILTLHEERWRYIANWYFVPHLTLGSDFENVCFWIRTTAYTKMKFIRSRRTPSYGLSCPFNCFLFWRPLVTHGNPMFNVTMLWTVDNSHVKGPLTLDNLTFDFWERASRSLTLWVLECSH